MSMKQLIEDASGFSGHAEQIYSPATEAEVLNVLASGQPITILGAGTGVAGGRVPLEGSALALEKFNKLEVHAGYAVAGAAVLLHDLHRAAAAGRQLYAPDPTETSASIGGTIACNASGSRSFLYGDTRRHVRALRVAMMDGTVRTFRRGEPVDFDVPAISLPATTKFSAGYRLTPGMDWVDLFIGSEGTLGVVLEAEVQLLPAPEELFTGVIFFDSEQGALDAVEAWRGVAGLRMLEFFDPASLDLVRTRFATTPKGAALLIEEEGDDIDAWSDRLEAAGAMIDDSWFAASAQDRERFRKFRHAVPELVNETVRRNGFLKLGSDYIVPVARNREMMRYYRQRLDAFTGRSVIFGHIGDAHVHVNILPAVGDEVEAAKEMMLDFARHAVALGGAVGAEHGLGKRKAHLLKLQYTEAELEAMRAVKRRLDPQWRLGRGTLFAAE